MLVRLDVTVWRGSIPESRHRVQAVALSETVFRILGKGDQYSEPDFVII